MAPTRQMSQNDKRADPKARPLEMLRVLQNYQGLATEPQPPWPFWLHERTGGPPLVLVIVNVRVPPFAFEVAVTV